MNNKISFGLNLILSQINQEQKLSENDIKKQKFNEIFNILEKAIKQIKEIENGYKYN